MEMVAAGAARSRGLGWAWDIFIDLIAAINIDYITFRVDGIWNMI